MRSVAADWVAVTIAHSTGHGTSSLFTVSASEARDTVTPSLTSAAACLRFAGVTRFSVPISSSFPQRPQFESSVCQRSNWARVTSGREPAAGDWAVDGGGTAEKIVAPISTDRTTARMLTWLSHLSGDDAPILARSRYYG